MRRADASAPVDDAQRAAADAGLKGMIPIGRPFLDYVVSALADAGITDVCLVVAPEHRRMRDHYRTESPPRRVSIHFAVQPEPRGTADAVLAAEPFAAGDHVLVLNSDNYYPVHTLRALRELGTAGVAAFERDALVRLGNVSAGRVASYSVLDIADDGTLGRIVEKPDAATIAALGDEVYVGMNSWSLPPEIFEACRAIERSPRGELELPSAVQYAIDELGVRFRAPRFRDGVLDLSSRADIASVAERLRDVEPRP